MKNNLFYGFIMTILSLAVLLTFTTCDGPNNPDPKEEPDLFVASGTMNLGIGSKTEYEIRTRTATVTISDYADPATIGPINIDLPAEDGDKFVGKALSIILGSKSPTTISLAEVHYIREAFKAAGTGITIADVTAPASEFTPVFKGTDWFSVSGTNTLNLYSTYTATTPLMNGISVVMKDGKPAIKYDRDIVFSNAVYNKIADTGRPVTPCYGMGIVKGTGNILWPEGENWYNVRTHQRS